MDGQWPFAWIPIGRAGASSGLRAGISLARAGDMDLARRRELPYRGRLLSALGVEPSRARAVRQVHSRTVVRVDGRGPVDGPFVEADGMVSDRQDLLLTVTVADCLPIFLEDRRTAAFGIVHSGWKGTGIVVEAIRAMTTAYGSRPADLAVTVGPGIGPCCYTVPRERAERFLAEFGPGAVARGPEADHRLDLAAANVRLLERGGVEDVTVITDCTSCTAGLGSSRREGAGAFTRMLAFIGAFNGAASPAEA